MAKREKSKGGGGKLLLLVLLLAAIAIAAYFLRDCGAGFGLGGKGPGEGGAGSAAPSAAPSAPAASASAAPAQTLSIRVTGTTCVVGASEPAIACEEACKKADEETTGRDKREIELYPSKGSQEIVENLKKCLTEKGISIGREIRD